MSEFYRLFIAIEVEEQLKENIRRVVEKLSRQGGTNVRWVAPANIHITLRFIGMADERLIAAIRDILQEVARHYQPFEISLEGLGGFPNFHSPRVIWIGVKDNSGSLPRIYEEIESGLVKSGLPEDDHPFSSHLTIGRVKSAPAKAGRDKLVELLKAEQGFVAGKETVQSLTLFNSQLRPQGPIYTTVHAAPLGTARA